MKPKKLTKEQIHLYKEILESIELIDIELVECKLKKYSSPSSEDLSAELITKVSSHKLETKKEKLIVNYKLDFHISEKIEDNEKKLLEIKGMFKINYSIKTKVKNDIIKIFINKNVPLNIHPFVRELIHSFLPKSGFPSFTVPLLKLKNN
jgi:preprotein translocase subunit SecB